jgi:hypothetical protein
MSKISDESFLFLNEQDRRVLALWIRGHDRPYGINPARWWAFKNCEAGKISLETELPSIVELTGYGILSKLRT